MTGDCSENHADRNQATSNGLSDGLEFLCSFIARSDPHGSPRRRPDRRQVRLVEEALTSWSGCLQVVIATAYVSILIGGVFAATGLCASIIDEVRTSASGLRRHPSLD